MQRVIGRHASDRLEVWLPWLCERPNQQCDGSSDVCLGKQRGDRLVVEEDHRIIPATSRPASGGGGLKGSLSAGVVRRTSVARQPHCGRQHREPALREAPAGYGGVLDQPVEIRGVKGAPADADMDPAWPTGGNEDRYPSFGVIGTQNGVEPTVADPHAPADGRPELARDHRDGEIVGSDQQGVEAGMHVGHGGIPSIMVPTVGIKVVSMHRVHLSGRI